MHSIALHNLRKDIETIEEKRPILDRLSQRPRDTFLLYKFLCFFIFTYHILLLLNIKQVYKTIQRLQKKIYIHNKSLSQRLLWRLSRRSRVSLCPTRMESLWQRIVGKRKTSYLSIPDIFLYLKSQNTKRYSSSVAKNLRTFW